MNNRMRVVIFILLSTIQINNVFANTFFDISPSESNQFKASRPYFIQRLGRVTVEADTQYPFLDDFRHALRNNLFESGAFNNEAENKLKLNATFLQVSQSIDGFQISYALKINYNLLDGDKVIGSWIVTTQATSTSLRGDRRADYALGTATQRNIRSFLLSLKYSYDPAGSEVARQALIDLGGESNSDAMNISSLAGYLILGTATAVKTTASVAGTVLTGLADVCRSDPSCAEKSSGSTSNTFAQEMNKQQNFINDLNKIRNDANQETNRRIQENQERAAAQQRANERVAAERREEERANQRAAERRTQDNERSRQQTLASQQRDNERQQDQERQRNIARQQELARQQEQARNADQARRDEQVRNQEQERKKNEAAASRLAEQQAEKQAVVQYLRAVQSGIRLGVKNCYGQYEVGGTLPKIKPEVVSCIDVYYRARCEGSAANYGGVIKNFTGFDAGCFGDTATISPKPDCPVSQVHVSVDEVRKCGG